MPKIVDHARYRKELLVRCFDLFAQRGDSTLTMRHITELFLFLSEHEHDLQKQFLVTFNYYQHRNLYESNVDAVVQAGFDRYAQALRDAIGVHDPQFIFSLQCQIQGLLTLHMFHHKQAPLSSRHAPVFKCWQAMLMARSGPR